ncbi:DUF2651 domain-containing protein [Bacillus sp. BHET2]|uniref:DUF2651 family protein n=1 Tax=Bacillus sp. BHET2 TaxID=2583818 RepID=UPI00110EA2FD|nr:DUF2651 family protein [Bacillus sp. BHET2]TMU87273.1 DUF2651 domain-containing protein [Bacillus sp. BHET2]
MDIVFMILVGFPALSIIIGVAGYFLFQTLMVSPVIVFISTLVATFTIFNDTFLIWVFVYTFLAFLSGFVFKKIIEKKGALDS